MIPSLGESLQDRRRLDVLRRAGLLDTPPEEAFDRLTRLAAGVLRAPVALVSVLGEERQFFKSQVGLPEPWASRRETPLSHSFCRHEVASARPLIVEDARTHPLLCDNLAIPDLGVVAYAGMPLITRQGYVLGSFCVLDTQPRRWTDDEIAILADLAASAVTEIELRLAAQEAEAERARLFGLLQDAPAAICLLRGPSHVIEHVNVRCWEIVGDREVVGRPVRDALPDAISRSLVEFLDRVYATGERLTGADVPVRLADWHETRYFNFVCQPTRDAAGGAGGIFVHAVEVTEQVRARRTVEALAAEREAVLAQTAEGVIVADAQGRISFVNEAARRLHGVAALGVPVEEYTATYHLCTMDGQPYPSEDLPLARAVRQGETVLDALWRVRRPDGAEIVAQGSATPVWAADGTRLGSVLVMRDVTAQVELDREKDAFLGAAAHDLRTPLAVVKGTAQLLRRQSAGAATPLPESFVEGLRTVEDTASRMARLIDDLLDVSHVRLGRALPLQRRPADLVALARQIAAAHQQATERHRIRVDTALSELVGQWDAERLARVLDNLVGNAVKYSPGGGDIAITLRAEPDERPRWAVLAVRDEGIGIAAGDQAHIFDRFRRAANVPARIAGTGIGLAVVRQIVEQHGGQIRVESREGSGSTFTVRLPLT